MYIRVIPFSGTFDMWGLIYRVPENLVASISPGKIVTISLKNKEILALVAELNCDISAIHYAIKDIETLLSDIVFFSQKYIGFMDFIATYYFCPIHRVASLFFPPYIQKKLKNFSYQKIKDYEILQKDTSLVLDENQNRIFKNISESVHKKHLLFGVTGSGKTHIYMKLIERNLSQGKQTLLLLPEILLSTHLVEKIIEYFGDAVVLIHSDISEAKKAYYWKNIQNGNIKIVVGTRSSIFLPFQNLGIILMDEEHDASYISDTSPRYHSLELCEYISKVFDIPLILGSGTPQIETFYRALRGEFLLHQLLKSYSEE